MIVCLQLGCFANHHGACVGDRELAMQLRNCDKLDELPVEGSYPYNNDDE